MAASSAPASNPDTAFFLTMDFPFCVGLCSVLDDAIDNSITEILLFDKF